MLEIMVEVKIGNDIRTIGREAQELALRLNAGIVFKINGVMCHVSPHRGVSRLVREYHRALDNPDRPQIAFN